MARRHPRENVLVRWTIDESQWREFLIEKEARDRDSRFYQVTFEAPAPFPTSGIEVVIRHDAVFVGKSCVLEYVYEGGYHGISVRDSILEMRMTSDAGDHLYLLPIARQVRFQAERIAQRLIAADKELLARRAEEYTRPTFLNRLRDWIEAHFVFVVLAFFFGVIPFFGILCPPADRASVPIASARAEVGVE